MNELAGDVVWFFVYFVLDYIDGCGFPDIQFFYSLFRIHTKVG